MTIAEKRNTCTKAPRPAGSANEPRERATRKERRDHENRSSSSRNRTSWTGRVWGDAVSTSMDVQLLASVGVYRRLYPLNEYPEHLLESEEPGCPPAAYAGRASGGNQNRPENARLWLISVAAGSDGLLRLRPSFWLVAGANGCHRGWRCLGGNWSWDRHACRHPE